MKFSANLWNRKYDGIQFFVQRLEKMLFHYSDDIVRSPVHNTQILIVEYIETEKLISLTLQVTIIIKRRIKYLQKISKWWGVANDTSPSN